MSTLQTNTSVASSLGTYFLSQISLIFLDMLNVYRYDFRYEVMLPQHDVVSLDFSNNGD